jgi:hypothetical protein
LISDKENGFRTIVSIFKGCVSAGSAGGVFQGAKNSGHCLQHAGANGQEMEFTFAAHVNDTRDLEFLDVV